MRKKIIKGLSMALAMVLSVAGVSGIASIDAKADYIPVGDVSIGQTVSLEYGYGKPMLYTLKVNKSGKITLFFDGGSYFYGVIRDSAGKELVGSHNNVASAQVIAGTYMVGSGDGNSTGSCSMRVEFTPSSETVPESVLEKYDTPANAVDYKGKSMVGQLARNDRADAFKYVLKEKSNVSIEIASEELETREIELLDGDGKRIFIKDYSGAGSNRENVTLDKGTYYVIVTGPWSYGEYKLSISKETAKDKVYRLLNPKNNDHIYTINESEKDQMLRDGWEEELSPGYSVPGGVAIYRLTNIASREHMFTANKTEKNALSQNGWEVDNGGNPVFYGSKSGNAVYRLFNPNAASAIDSHHFTLDQNEIRILTSLGWEKDNNGQPVFYLE